MSFPRLVASLIAAGLVVRLVLAFTTDGEVYDMESLRLVRDALGSAPLDAYATLNVPDQGFRWPYPSAYLPFIPVAGGLSDLTGLAYTSLIRVPPMLADVAIALVVQAYLARRGFGERRRLAAVALVMLGPSFLVVSGHHGQIDSVAILPAVAAFAVWDRNPHGRRALYAGALIGLAGAVKTAPLVMLLALLPAVGSRREALTLVAAAVAVPLALMVPFLLSTPDAVRHALGYKGFPGTSGLTFLLQPELSEQLGRDVPKSSLVEFLHERGQVLVVLALLATTALTLRLREVDRAVALWLAFYVVTPVFFFQYLVWGLAFLLLAGRLRLALAVQAVALAPMLIFYSRPYFSTFASHVYWVTVVALWALLLASLVVLLRERRPPRVAPGTA